MNAQHVLLATLIFSLTMTAALADDEAVKDRPPEQWVCTFAGTKTTENGDGSSPTTKNSSLVLTLAPTHFLVRESEGSELGELSTETYYRFGLPRADRPCLAASFYGWTYFRVMEFQNREAISVFEKAAGLPATPKFELESFFGVQVPPRGQSKAVEVTPVSNGWNFAHDNRVVTTVVRSDHRLPKPLTGSWILFLAHQCRLHPEVRKVLSTEPHVPKSLRFSFVDVDAQDKRTTVDYQLQSVRVVPAETVASLLNGQRITKTEDERLGKLLEKLATTTVTATEDALQTAIQVVDAEVRAGRYMDALLASNEYFHQTGDQAGLRSIMKDLRPKIMSDPLVRRFFALEGGSAQLGALRKSAQENKCQRIHVLDYLVADASLEEDIPKTEVREMLFAILDKHPMLCGALIDLGRTYLSDYDTFDAELCFRAARRMYPRHEALQDLDTMERQIRTDFPDFFAPRELTNQTDVKPRGEYPGKRPVER